MLLSQLMAQGAKPAASQSPSVPFLKLGAICKATATRAGRTKTFSSWFLYVAHMSTASACLKTISPTAPSSTPLSFRTTWPSTRPAMLECRVRPDRTAFLAHRLSKRKIQHSGSCKREHNSIETAQNAPVFQTLRQTFS